MATKEIYEKEGAYARLRSYVNFFFRNSFKEIVINGTENLPANAPYILAPNHQNALTDALTIIYTLKDEQPVFMARADLFGKKPLLDKILFFLNIMPIFRMRDGFENLGKNEAYFNKAVEVLTHKVPLCLFAEGRHNNKHQQLPLVKGLFRIALQAEEQLDEKNLQIIPVGIEYENYSRFGSTLLVNIGKPVDVLPFYEEALENPTNGMNDLRSFIGEEMSYLMWDIRSKNHYTDFFELSYLLESVVCSHDQKKAGAWNRFMSRKQLSAQLDSIEQQQPEQLDLILNTYHEYQSFFPKNKAWHPAFSKTLSLVECILKSILYLIFLPVFIAGYCLNFLPFGIHHLIINKIKDPQFHHSITLVLRLVSFPLFYLLYMIVGVCVFSIGWWCLVIPPAAFFLGKAAWIYWDRFRFFSKQAHTLFLSKDKKKTIQSLRNQLYQFIMEQPLS